MLSHLLENAYFKVYIFYIKLTKLLLNMHLHLLGMNTTDVLIPLIPYPVSEMVSGSTVIRFSSTTIFLGILFNPAIHNEDSFCMEY